MKLDPVDQKALKGSLKNAKDKDINNDGKSDSTDEYLHNRRQAVSKAIGKLKEEAEELNELSQDKLYDYHAKAAADLRAKRTKVDQGSLTMNDLKKGQNRVKGLNTAANKMKEEVKIDEAAKKDWDYTDEALALLKKAEDAGIKVIRKDKYVKGMKALGPKMPRKANVEALTRALQALKNGESVRPVEYWVG